MEASNEAEADAMVLPLSTGFSSRPIVDYLVDNAIINRLSVDTCINIGIILLH